MQTRRYLHTEHAYMRVDTGAAPHYLLLLHNLQAGSTHGHCITAVPAANNRARMAASQQESEHETFNRAHTQVMTKAPTHLARSLPCCSYCSRVDNVQATVVTAVDPTDHQVKPPALQQSMTQQILT
jgi:hypothetical protein